jgi:hypothetical protein
MGCPPEPRTAERARSAGWVRTTKEETMKLFARMGAYVAMAGLSLLIACRGAAPAAEPMPAFEMQAMDEAALGAAPAAELEPAPPPPDSQAVLYRTDGEQAPAAQERASRLLIKNGEIRLLVADTDTAIDGALQVIEQAGGYLINSRVWFQEWGGENLKYATLTFGVPANQFERSLRRLRLLGIRLMDETTTGQDVTEEYVDLQSRVESLQATRARILEFLDQAQSVAEALTVNQELAAVEAQIEEVQGRINYLADRSAYSTITVNLEPELVEFEPTATPTPTVTPTSTPWNPGRTFDRAKRTVTVAYQELAIWLGVVVLPILAVPAVLVLLAWVVARRRARRKPGGEDAGKD